ncbi:MAG: Smr/MutS family protein [Opitutaceae bacterium]
MPKPESTPAGEDALPLPITDELDLHTFRADEIETLLEDYLAACAERGLRTVRIIHGKGTGALRERVHAWLRRSPRVASFALCEAGSGGWGATRAVLAQRRD